MRPQTRISNAEACARYRRGYPDRRRDTLLKHKYGITLSDFNRMLKEQGGRCAICQNDEPGRSGQWLVDHCHDTGEVRGLLCHKCNSGIGLLRDSVPIVRSALRYLKRSTDQHTGGTDILKT